ncbi:MAG: pilus assembly protein PilM [Candidatus Vogelbacteria bacterium]
MKFSFFPRAVGVDIADRSIEIVELRQRGRNPRVTALGRVVLPAGVVERGVIKDRPALALALREAFRAAKTTDGQKKQSSGVAPHRIVFGLSDSQIYIHSFSCLWSKVPKGDELLGALVLAEAREHIPLEESDLLISYKILQRTEVGFDFLVAGASRRLLDDWSNFFTELGLAAEFDLETIATFRGIFPESIERPVMIVDCGSVATTLAVFDHRGLRYSRTLSTGGEALTKAVVTALKVDYEVAEEKKQEIGILDPESKIFTILLRELALVKDEIKTTIDYYEKWSGHKIHGLLLTGGGSQLRGLPEYLRSNLELPAGIARSPFVKQPIVYLEAIGLALGGLGRRGADELTMRVGVHTGSGLGRRSSLRQALGNNLGLVIFITIIVLGAGLLIWAFQYRHAVEADQIAARQTVLDAIPIAPVVPVDNSALIASTTGEISTSSSPNANPASRTLEISQTPTGWLNVRSGPGTAFVSVGRVNPGEVYPLLAEEGEWYRIKFVSEGRDKEGWVAKQYTIIKN